MNTIDKIKSLCIYPSAYELLYETDPDYWRGLDLFMQGEIRRVDDFESFVYVLINNVHVLVVDSTGGDYTGGDVVGHYTLDEFKQMTEEYIGNDYDD